MEVLSLIQDNIDKYGYHRYVVLQGVCPRYSYTIGLYNSIGLELICGGMCLFDAEDISVIFSDIVSALRSDISTERVFHTQRGSFGLRKVHKSWIKFAALGAVDYYNSEDVEFYQKFSNNVSTIDDVDMSSLLDANIQSAWKYLCSDW